MRCHGPQMLIIKFNEKQDLQLQLYFEPLRTTSRDQNPYCLIRESNPISVDPKASQVNPVKAIESEIQKGNKCHIKIKIKQNKVNFAAERVNVDRVL